MKLYKRMVTAILRQPIRYLLLFMVIFLLECMQLGGSLFNSAVIEIETDIKKQLQAVATIQGTIGSLNLNGSYPPGSQYDQIFHDYYTLIQKCAENDHLQYSNISLFQDYIRVENAIEKEDMWNWGGMLVGVSNTELQEERLGIVEISQGRSFRDAELEHENVAIIPENLVYEDGREVRLGDMITVFYDENFKNWRAESGYNYPQIELKVIGKYKLIKTTADDPRLNYQHRIYVPNHVVLNYSNSVRNDIESFLEIDDLMNNYNYDYYLPCGIFAPYFELNSYNDLDEFKMYCENELMSKDPISSIYRFVSTSEAADRIMEPLRSGDKMSKLIVFISTLASGSIMILFIYLFTKNRAHELALYLTLGERKKKILFQLAGELSLICLLVITFAGLSYKPIANEVYNRLIGVIPNEKIELSVDQKLEKENEYYLSGQYILDSDQIENHYSLKNFEMEFTMEDYFKGCVFVVVEDIIGCFIIFAVIMKTNPKAMWN